MIGLRNWLNELSKLDVTNLFNWLLKHPNPKVRRGAVLIVEQLEDTTAADAVMSNIRDESDTDVRCVILHCMSSLGRRLSKDLAQFLLDTDKDWLVQSYALRDLDGHRSCLLISDGTDFATQIEIIVQKVGFRTVRLTDTLFYLETKMIESAVLQAYEMIILVRGEHFTQYGKEDFYSILRHFVANGGVLFATSWVSWETKYNREFTSVLPFLHIRDSFEENVSITCEPTECKLAQNLFPNRFSYRTSLELLRDREGSQVLLKTFNDIPIFGYKPFGSGICYYLNTCQHDCLGEMVSPLVASPELYNGLKRVFKWIFRTTKYPDAQAVAQGFSETATASKILPIANKKKRKIQPPKVFISYSQRDENEKEDLLSHLGVLQSAGLIELWTVDQISAGAIWKTEIGQAIAQAKLAILLISANFLTSDFILNQEIPSLLKRREREGLIIFPIIIKSCAWRTIDWLVKMNVRPTNGRSIWSGDSQQVDENLTAIAEEIAVIAREENLI